MSLLTSGEGPSPSAPQSPANKGVDRYLSANEAGIPTISFLALSGFAASISIACSTAPEALAALTISGLQLGQVLDVDVDEAEIVIRERALAFGGPLSHRLGPTVQAFSLDDTPDAVAIEVRQEVADDERQVVEWEVGRPVPVHPTRKGQRQVNRLGAPISAVVMRPAAIAAHHRLGEYGRKGRRGLRCLGWPAPACPGAIAGLAFPV
jgi:hypothetical protein